MTPTEIAQQLINGAWMHASAALEACQRGNWAEFARTSAPRRPWLFGRFAHARCLALAEGSLTGPVETKVTLVPLWACRAYETSSTDWVAVHGVAWEAQSLEVLESSPHVEDAALRADALWECRVRKWTASSVVKTDHYDASVPFRLQSGAFGVLELPFVEVLSVDVRSIESLPRPTREVPLFSVWHEPRVAVGTELESQIRGLNVTAPADFDD